MFAPLRVLISAGDPTSGRSTRNLVGAGRFELPASCSQDGNAGVSGRVGLCRNPSKRSDLAGVMPARTDTRRTGRHTPVLPELIHR